MSKGMAEPAEVSLGHSTGETCENRQRKGPGGHQETETAYQSVQKQTTREGYLSEDRLEAESRRQNRRTVADKQPKAEAHLFDD